MGTEKFLKFQEPKKYASPDKNEAGF